MRNKPATVARPCSSVGRVLDISKVIMCWIAELTGSESPVRAASALAICSWLGLPAVGGSGRAKGKLTSVERGGPCPALWARYVNFRL